MTNRRCWQRPALFLAGCALVGCWIARSNSTTNDAEQHHPKARVPATRWGRMPLDPADSEHVPRTGDRWNFKVHADKPTSRDELWRRLSPRTSIGASVDDDVVVRVIVGYRNADGLAKLLRQKPLLQTSANAAADLPSLSGLSRIHALASAFRFVDLHALVDDPDVAYIDLDSIVSGAEHRPPQPKRDAIPVGMYQVQNGPKSAVRRQYYNTNAAEQRPAGSGTSSSGSGATGPCLDEKALRVAIVDSGVDLDHPDLPCHLPQTCIGRDFTGSGAWDAPDNDHGTHVMGTLAALPNGVGVLGMVPDPASVCWIVAKVLDKNNQGLMSHVLEGAEWAAFQHRATVINLSIAGGSYMNSAAELFKEIRARGSLVVAAAGNDGDSEYSYPASYDSVISVGSVGEDGLYADYSVRNSKVDLVAPGTNVFSTVRIGSTDDNVMASITFRGVDGDEVTVPGMMTHDSREAPYIIGGPLIECYLPSCPGSPGGHVCLIERGHALYSTIAAWCQDSGGIAAIIYHGEKNGHFNAHLNPTGPVTIPVIATTRSDGKLLLQRSAPGSAVVIQVQVGYSVMSGTSMACPVASGALAALGQACPGCDAGTLEQCLFVTAVDLGEPGHDELYGYGKVQASSALACLQRPCC